MGIHTPRLAPGVMLFSTTNTTAPAAQGNVQTAASPGLNDQFVTKDAQASPLDHQSGVSTAHGVFGYAPSVSVEQLVAAVKAAYDKLQTYPDDEQDEDTAEKMRVAAENYFNAIDAVARRAGQGSEAALRAVDGVIGDLVGVLYHKLLKINDPNVAQAFFDWQERGMPIDLLPKWERIVDPAADAEGLEKRLEKRADSLNHLWLLYEGIARRSERINPRVPSQWRDDFDHEYCMIERLAAFERDLVASSILNVIDSACREGRGSDLDFVAAFRKEYVRLGKNVAALMSDPEIDELISLMCHDPETWAKKLDTRRLAGNSSTQSWGIQELVHVLKQQAGFQEAANKLIEASKDIVEKKEVSDDDLRVFKYFVAFSVRDVWIGSWYQEYKSRLERQDLFEDLKKFRAYSSMAILSLKNEGDQAMADIYSELVLKYQA